jgi:hypothetical protein
VRGATVVVPPGQARRQDAIDAANRRHHASSSASIRSRHHQGDQAARRAQHVRREANGTTRVGRWWRADDQIFADGAQLPASTSSATARRVTIAGDRIKLTDVFVQVQCAVVSSPLIDVVNSTREAQQGGRRDRPSDRARGHPHRRHAAGGQVKIMKSIAGGNDVGILLENNGIGAVRVAASDVNFNQRGIVLVNTSRAVVHHNELVDNPVSGIELDATSSGNSIVRNVISGSGNDVVDAGAGNCWRNNTFTTGSVPPCP